MTQAHRPQMSASTVLVIVVLSSSMFVSACAKGPQSSGAVSPAQAETYKSQLELSHMGLAKGESYLGNEVFYVEGVLKNNSSRAIQRVELLFLFKDSLNQVVLRETRK